MMNSRTHSPPRAHRSWQLVALAGAGLAFSLPAVAQEPEITPIGSSANLDSPSIIAKSSTRLSADVRLFGSAEDITYLNLGLGYGLRDNLELILRGAIADERTYTAGSAAIHHGGNDVELLLKLGRATGTDLRRGSWALEVGVSAPSTPAQNSLFPTLQLASAFHVGSKLTLHFVPKAVFIEDDPLVGIGGGVALQLGRSTDLVADLTGIVSGNNTYGTSSGVRTRGEVWGVMLRHRSVTSSGELGIELGVTNGIGRTTGFSLTPGLGGSAAVILGVTWRR